MITRGRVRFAGKVALRRDRWVEYDVHFELLGGLCPFPSKGQMVSSLLKEREHHTFPAPPGLQPAPKAKM